MKQITSLLAALLVVLACAGCGGGGGGPEALSQNACSLLNRSARIIDGTQCSAATSPVVSIELNGFLGSSSLCSGTVISSTAILTAAHCFIIAEPATVVVNVHGRRVRATNWHVHPAAVIDNTVGLVFNDYAVVTVGQDLGVTPVPLVTSRSPGGGDIISIFGYGYDENETLGILRSGQMRIDSVDDTHIFADFSQGDGSNTCQGDSGGPALLEFDDANGDPVNGIIGITSTGKIVNCLDGDRSAFARSDISTALDFILRFVPDVGAI